MLRPSAVWLCVSIVRELCWKKERYINPSSILLFRKSFCSYWVTCLSPRCPVQRKLTNDITKDRDKINEVKRIWHSHKSRQQRCRKMHPYSGKSTNPHQRAEHRPAGAFSPALSGDGDSGFSSPGQGGGRLSGAAAVGGVAAAHYSSNTNTSSNFAAPPSRPPSWSCPHTLLFCLCHKLAVVFIQRSFRT